MSDCVQVPWGLQGAQADFKYLDWERKNLLSHKIIKWQFKAESDSKLTGFLNVWFKFKLGGID